MLSRAPGSHPAIKLSTSLQGLWPLPENERCVHLRIAPCGHALVLFLLPWHPTGHRSYDHHPARILYRVHPWRWDRCRYRPSSEHAPGLLRAFAFTTHNWSRQRAYYAPEGGVEALKRYDAIYLVQSGALPLARKPTCISISSTCRYGRYTRPTLISLLSIYWPGVQMVRPIRTTDTPTGARPAPCPRCPGPSALG